MHFAVYTLNKETSDLLLCLFDTYRKEREHRFSCHFFENEVDLLCELTPGDYEALFFCALRSSLVDEIRQRDRHIRLVGITPAGAHHTDSLKDLWHCLPEPMDALFLFPMLDRLFAEVYKSEDVGMVIKTKSSLLHLVFAQIEYAEVLGKAILFHLTDGHIEEFPGTFSDYEARLLQWPDFIKAHRAYIVNMRHIAKLSADGILTRYGCSVPVSARLYPQLRKDYLEGMKLPGIKRTEETPAPMTAEKECKSLYTILLVDDESGELFRWSQILIKRGCCVRTADTGEAALALAERERFDCVVLDVNMGKECGFDLCGVLREKTGAPVVFLSILSDIQNQERGFLTGGIDYITKDVSPDLFWLKIETRIKMAGELRSEMTSGGLCLDLKNRKAFLHGQAIPLTAVEFDLLYQLMQNPGTPFTPEKLFGLIWGSRQWDDGHTVQLHISQLCRKLESADPRHSYIKTIWGKGYCFVLET